MKFNLKAIENFRMTMITGSATGAASKLGITQSTSSRLIAQLEKDIGFTLFFREKGRLLPTPEAHLLYEQVDLTFGGIQRLDAFVKDIAQFNEGQLRVVAPSGITEGVLPAILSKFYEKYPNVRVSIDSRDVETSLLMVANRVADCGFAKLPLGRSDLTSVTLSISDTVCVLPKSHMLASKTEITPELLNQESLIMLGSGSWLRAKIDHAFRKASIIPKVRIETRTVGSSCACVSNGLGIAIVNELIAREHLTEHTIMLPFRPKVLHEYAFITSSATPIGRLANALLEVAKQFFSELSSYDYTQFSLK